MVFSSLTFLYIFLTVTVGVYFILPGIRTKNVWLLCVSLFFYAWGEPVCVLLMAFVAFVNYFFGRLINHTRGTPYAKKYLVIAVILSLAGLIFFKYTGFIIEIINVPIGAILPWKIPVPQITMPIGISFFTFQALSYTIDVYRNETEVQKNYAYFLMYVTFFPQLIAGPIVRYSDINAQILKRKVTLKGFSQGATRFLAGLGKKVLIGNYAGGLVSQLIGPSVASADFTTTSTWLGIIFYAIQIYFDFSGYSDMAIGMGQMFGFKFLENFNYPYIANSITDFWRRWHMSLSSFFRDYVYIPLGGNRRLQFRNLFVVWLLTGLWHGASVNFVMWGLYYFLFLVIEKYLLKNIMEKIPSVIRHVYSLLVVLVGWVFFYFDDMKRMWSALGTMFGLTSNHFTGALIEEGVLIGNIPFLLIAVIACLPAARLTKNAVNSLSRKSYGWDTATVAMVAGYNAFMIFWCTAAMAGSTFNPFLYFRF